MFLVGQRVDHHCRAASRRASACKCALRALWSLEHIVDVDLGLLEVLDFAPARGMLTLVLTLYLLLNVSRQPVATLEALGGGSHPARLRLEGRHVRLFKLVGVLQQVRHRAEALERDGPLAGDGWPVALPLANLPVPHGRRPLGRPARAGPIPSLPPLDVRQRLRGLGALLVRAGARARARAHAL